MAKGFTYKWPINKNASDSAGFARTIIENFKDILVYLNAYVVQKELDGSTVALDDLVVAGTLSLADSPYAADGPEYIHLYRDATQAISGGSWEPVAVNNVVGTAGPTFIADTPNNEADATKAGLFFALGQVEFTTAQSGYIRVTADGTEIARQGYSSRTGCQVVAIVPTVAAVAFKVEVFNTGAATIAAGSNASFLRVARLYSFV